MHHVQHSLTVRRITLAHGSRFAPCVSLACSSAAARMFRLCCFSIVICQQPAPAPAQGRLTQQTLSAMILVSERCSSKTLLAPSASPLGPSPPAQTPLIDQRSLTSGSPDAPPTHSAIGQTCGATDVRHDEGARQGREGAEGATRRQESLEMQRQHRGRPHPAGTCAGLLLCHEWKTLAGESCTSKVSAPGEASRATPPFCFAFKATVCFENEPFALITKCRRQKIQQCGRTAHHPPA